VIEAVQWTGDPEPMMEFLRTGKEFDVFYHADHTLDIHTLEGKLTANPGDWIVKEIEGEFYTVRNDIFEKTYGLVE